jgi:hypothetical protein
MIIVNGNREFAARFVIVERTVIEERSANIIFVECGEPTLGFFEGERGSKRLQSERGTQLRWLPVAIFENRANLRKHAWWKGGALATLAHNEGSTWFCHPIVTRL